MIILQWLTVFIASAYYVRGIPAYRCSQL